LDVDANPLIPKRYGVRELPFFLALSNGEVAKRLGGQRTKDELAEALNGAMASRGPPP
jgi:hypothetical protein